MIRANPSEGPISRSTPPVADRPDRACADADPEIFFPERGPAVQARALCGVCPHRQDCLDWALDTRQMFGILGGMSPDERARIIRTRDRKGHP